MSDHVKELEKAAQCVLASPNVVSPEERRAAENIFIEFRKSHLPYAMCRHILEHCKDDYVLFQAAATIKESIVREWTLLGGQDIETLRSFLLHYVISHSSLQAYVREQILQAVAVIFKRATVSNCDAIDKESIFNNVTQLISSGNLTMQLIACSILTSLLNEFSTTNKTSNVGLTLEFHRKCKVIFEQRDLQRVFSFCLEVLHELETAPSPLTREMTAVFNRMLAIIEQVLSWHFIPKHATRRINDAVLRNQSISFKPPLLWSDMVLDKKLVNMMFTIHRKIRFNSEMAHHSLQCLSQLSTLNGPVLSDDKSRCEYLDNFTRAFLELTGQHLQDYEALGIANIVNNLLVFFPIENFLALDKGLLERFIDTMAQLTCQFGQAAALEEAMHKDDALYQEAYEKLLDSWMNFLVSTCAIPQDTLQPRALQIFNSYLKCHLAPPHGTRDQGEDGAVAGEDTEEYDEIQEDDRDRFADQLKCIGALGRLVPDKTLPLLFRLLEDRISRLHSHLQRLSHQPNLGNTSIDMTIINTLNEDLHWLLLISAHVLTENVEGESPIIPLAIMNMCINETQKVNVDTTLKVLGSPGLKIEDIPGAEQCTDTVVRLVSSVFRLCEVENRAIGANLAFLLSPQVGSSMMWFFKQWVVSYLLPNENHYVELSCALTAAFGQDSEGGMWTVGFLMDKIILNIQTWSSEVKLATDTLEMLLSLVSKRQRSAFVIKCPNFLKLAKDTAENVHPYNALPPSCMRLLSRALASAGSTSFDGQITTKEDYWHLITQSVHGRFKEIITKPDFKQNMAFGTVKEEILSLLESLCGIVEACLCTSATMTFQLLYPIMSELTQLLELYHNYEEVVVLILELFKETCCNILVYLGEKDSHRLYDCCLKIIQVYSKYNVGNKCSNKYEEEEQYEDLCILLEMLTSLLSKDFIVFGSEENSSVDDGGGGTVVVNVEDVVLYALNSIVPIMNAELLKFPALCLNFMRLVTYMAEMYAEKVCQLPDELLQNLLAAIEYGLTSLGSDVVMLCLEFLSYVAEDLCKRSVQNGVMYTSMAHFLKVVFNKLVLDVFDMELFDTASQTLFALICCHQEQYKILVNELLQEQADNYHRLAEAFNHLTPTDLQLVINRPNRLMFMKNFDKFLNEVRGFLCVR